jgi:hypothetical protein
MAAYIREHADGRPRLRAWADFIQALSPDGEAAQAFMRAQREHGHPDRYRPIADGGLHLVGRQSSLFNDHDPPHAGVLRELVALEGSDERLPPGAVFPMPPRPVRNGRPLWEVDVSVRSEVERVHDRWYEIPERLSHPQLDGYGSYGGSEGPDGVAVFQTSLRIWAVDEDEAASVAHELLDALLGDADAQRRVIATRAEAEDAFELPHTSKDYERRLLRTRWHRYEPSAVGVRIVWCTGPCPLARVEVDESPQQVTISLWERFPPRFAQGGARIGIPAILAIRCVEVPLIVPLGERRVIDGCTGAPPDVIDPFDCITPNDWAHVRDLDLDTLDCTTPPL